MTIFTNIKSWFHKFLELPWDKSIDDCYEYASWINGDYMTLTPWRKLDTMSFGLIRRILSADPRMRCTITDIQQHRWFIQTCTKSKQLLLSFHRSLFSYNLLIHNILSITSVVLLINFC